MMFYAASLAYWRRGCNDLTGFQRPETLLGLEKLLVVGERLRVFSQFGFGECLATALDLVANALGEKLGLLCSRANLGPRHVHMVGRGMGESRTALARAGKAPHRQPRRARDLAAELDLDSVCASCRFLSLSLQRLHHLARVDELDASQGILTLHPTADLDGPPPARLSMDRCRLGRRTECPASAQS